jgi:FixJ family two-component response regulator
LQQALLVAVVDDDESMRDTTRDFLESAGFAVAIFASARSLLESACLENVSCLITDIRMPGMTGIELQQHLVAEGRAIPTILMTAYPDERVRAMVLHPPIIGCLPKPFAADELLACVRSALRRSAWNLSGGTDGSDA